MAQTDLVVKPRLSTDVFLICGTNHTHYLTSAFSISLFIDWFYKVEKGEWKAMQPRISIVNDFETLQKIPTSIEKFSNYGFQVSPNL